MTELENGLADAPHSLETSGPHGRDGSTPPRRSAFRRVLEWFWSGSEMRALSAALPRKAVSELDRRARLSLELARFAIEQTFQNGSAEAVACELSREAVYWALLALRGLRTPNSGEGASLSPPRPTLAELWAGSEASLLARAAGGEAAADAIGSQLRESTFADLAELDSAARMRLTLDLRRVANAIIHEIDRADGEVDRIWTRRAVRVGGALALVAMVGVASMLLSAWLLQRRDLARGRPWTASSKFPDGGCASPLQSCPDSPSYFFHTLEDDNPWFLIDLQSTQRVSGIRVVNRLDCCNDRGVPLVVELSTDQKHWQRVARRAEEFSDWKSTFTPTPARWVRLTAQRRTLLHFSEVRVLR